MNFPVFLQQRRKTKQKTTNSILRKCVDDARADGHTETAILFWCSEMQQNELIYKTYIKPFFIAQELDISNILLHILESSKSVLK